MSTLLGKVLSGRYRIDESLGRGGMAEVYKAWDLQRATYLALKVLRQDLAQDLIFLRRFQREAQTLEKLQHPNIVRFYGIEQDDLQVFMLMEYIEGTTLQAEIFRNKGHSLNTDFTNHVIQSVCSSLHYAHNMGLVHCDIKPGNIMIDDSGKVMLTDFGIARMTDAATSTMVGFGTPAYMAPELVRGKDPTPQSDIYSLGVLLYEMITGGERPFTGEHSQTTGTISERVRWEQVNLEPPSPRIYKPSIETIFEEIIHKCLEKDPKERFASVQEISNSVEILRNQNFVTNSEPKFSVEQYLTPIAIQSSTKNQIKTAEVILDLEEEEFQEIGQKKLPPKRFARILGLPLWSILVGIIVFVCLIGIIIVTTIGVFKGLGKEEKETEEVSLYVGTIIETTQSPIESLLLSSTTEIKVNSELSETITITPSFVPSEIEPLSPTHIFTLEATRATGLADLVFNLTDGSTSVYVPEGYFIMGASEDDPIANQDEKPQRLIYLNTYIIDQYEVSIRMYRLCVNDGVCTKPLKMNNAINYFYEPEYDDYPITNVTWSMAQAYCSWAGKRLPTEAEWEKAARGWDARIYPWGDIASCNYANYLGCNKEKIVPVDSFSIGVSPYQVFNMAGNVWEWVADWYDPEYYTVMSEENPGGPGPSNFHIARGGSAQNNEIMMRSTYRFKFDANSTNTYIGFRCAETPAE